MENRLDPRGTLWAGRRKHRRGNARSFEFGGKHEEREVWLSIMDKVRELTAEHGAIPEFQQ